MNMDVAWDATGVAFETGDPNASPNLKIKGNSLNRLLVATMERARRKAVMLFPFLM